MALAGLLGRRADRGGPDHRFVAVIGGLLIALALVILTVIGISWWTAASASDAGISNKKWVPPKYPPPHRDKLFVVKMPPPPMPRCKPAKPDWKDCD